MILTGGDILKRDTILNSFTFEETIPYLKYKLKDVSFRDGIRQFIGIKDSIEQNNDTIISYCSACKKSGKADCNKCPKIFEVNDAINR